MIPTTLHRMTHHQTLEHGYVAGILLVAQGDGDRSTRQEEGQVANPETALSQAAIKQNQGCFWDAIQLTMNLKGKQFDAGIKRSAITADRSYWNTHVI